MRKLPTTPSITYHINTSAYIEESDATRFPKADLEKLITDKLSAALRPLGAVPADVSCVVSSEGAENDRVQKISAKVSFGKNRIASSTHARSIEKAIDRMVPDISRQARKYKTRKINKGREKTAAAKKELSLRRDFELVGD